MSAPNHRTLEEIGVDLSNALRNRTMDMLSVGRFLNEAREVADHGTWLPFLKLHRIDERSARRYMTGAAWCDAKSGNSPDSAFYLTPQAIYALASGKYADDVVEQVISAAQYRHIGIKDVQSIARSARRQRSCGRSRPRKKRRWLSVWPEPKRPASTSSAPIRSCA